VAAVAEDDFPALQSVYLLHPQPWLDPYALAAVLGSAVVAAYAYYTWTSLKRLHPQLTLNNVRHLPFPERCPRDALDRMATLGRKIAKEPDGEACKELERHMDEEVAGCFGLSLVECLPLLAPALDALPPSQRPRWWRGT